MTVSLGISAELEAKAGVYQHLHDEEVDNGLDGPQEPARHIRAPAERPAPTAFPAWVEVALRCGREVRVRGCDDALDAACARGRLGLDLGVDRRRSRTALATTPALARRGGELVRLLLRQAVAAVCGCRGVLVLTRAARLLELAHERHGGRHGGGLRNNGDGTRTPAIILVFGAHDHVDVRRFRTTRAREHEADLPACPGCGAGAPQRVQVPVENCQEEQTDA